ncbi:MAG: hypothetical protein D4R88_07470 [Methanosarcinales archaeon]|nr:MAG: hypothetical protein D4R88_07470 [Methanosarcinales archaeon]
MTMSKYKEMNTEHLINEMFSLCLEVPPELAQEIGSRDNAISFLKDILQNDEYWDHDAPGDGWAVVVALLRQPPVWGKHTGHQ